MKTIVTVSFCLLIACCLNTSYAQSNSPYSIGINAGVFIYTGDLAPARLGSWKTPSFVLGFTGHRSLSPVLSTRLEINIGSLRGDEATYGNPEYRQQRALAFNSRVTEAIIAAEWSPLGREKRLFPYAVAGVGFSSMKIAVNQTRFNAAYFAGEPELIQSLAKGLVNRPSGVLVLPVGIGAMYQINPKFTLNAEASHRLMRNDYIDGFSYSDDWKLKDGYTKYSIGLRYNWGYKDRNGCPANVY